jgi:rhomboid protease GluP
VRRKPEAFCTTVLIVINVAVFLILSMLGDTEDAAFMLQHGAMYEPFITEGQEYYRIFTCMFLHFGITHLMNNMVMLGALGWNLELEIGQLSGRGMIFMVVLSLYFGLTSSGVDNMAHIGGLICGFIFAVILYRPKKIHYNEY